MPNNKRLTKHWADNYVATELNYDFLFSLSKEETEKFNAIIKKLAEYEDLDEKGMLFKVPYKCGQQVWFIRNKKIIETEIEKIVLKNDKLYLKLGCNAMYETSCSAIGKTVFFHEKDAEEALKEEN